jgi:voltage-gated potassium channel
MNQSSNAPREIARAVLVLVVVVVGGTAGYMLVEGWSLGDAFFMTVTTVTTIGYGEVRDLSRRGELFTVALVAAGVGSALYALNVMVRLTLEGELRGALAERRLRRRIGQMRDHVVLCGFGRVGESIADTLTRRHHHVVVVENGQDAVRRLEAAGYAYVLGDATTDEALKAAGIERARALISALNSDADNSWVVLSARALNPTLRIVARAEHPGSEGKLRHAGADRVVAPARIAGGHMALAAVQPTLLDFTETAVPSHGKRLTLAQLTVEAGAASAGLSLADAVPGPDSITVLGVQRGDGELLVKPDPATVLAAGDELIVLGELAGLERLSSRTRADGGAAVG